MKKAIAAAIIAACVLGGSYMLLPRDHDTQSSTDLTSSIEAQRAPRADPALHEQRSPAHPSVQSSRPPARDLSVVDANNLQEIDWAARNLAYSPELLDRVRVRRASLESINPRDGFTIEELASAYEWAADEEAPTESRGRASDLLGEAATQGSIAALGSLASLHASGAAQNPIEAEAYFRLAEMRGDWSAGLRHGTTGLLYQLDSTGNTLAGLRAHEILAQLNATRFARGQPPLGVDPRPGLGRAIATIRRTMDEAKERTQPPTTSN